MNTPLPNPVNLNISAMNAAASKAAKQATNDGQEFKQVLANQVKTKNANNANNANTKDATPQPNSESNLKTREALAKEQAQQLQRKHLQVKANEQAPGQQVAGQQELDPALLAQAAPVAEPALPVDAAGQADLAANPLDKPLDPALASEQLAKDAALATAQALPVTPDVQPRLAGAVRDALSEMQTGEELGKQGIGLNAKDVVTDNAKLDKLTTAELEALLDKSAGNGAAVTAKSAADSQAAPLTSEQGQRFADALAQQAALQQTSATGHTVQTTAAQALAVDPRSSQIAVPFGQTAWNQAISQKVVWMAAGGEQTASLTLNPPDLGPLQVIIHVHNGQTDTTFLSDQADVRRALEDGMANLRDMMNQSGMQLGQADVRSGQQQAQSQQAGVRGQAGQDGAGNEVNPVLAKAAKVMGMVDTYV